MSKRKGKAQPPEKPKIGRPLKEVDENVIAQLAQAGVPRREIARIVGCSDDTLSRRFADFLADNDAKGKAALYIKIYDGAIRGNVKYALHLARTRLGQSERIQLTGADGGPIEHEMTIVEREKRAAEFFARAHRRMPQEIVAAPARRGVRF